MGVRPQVWNQLREGELLTCDSCSRLLYWDPAMAPAPKAPQPEPVPGAGRAVAQTTPGGRVTAIASRFYPVSSAVVQPLRAC